MASVLKSARMSRRLFAAAVLFFAATSVSANPFGYGWRFGWSLGNVKFSQDLIGGRPKTDAEVLHFNFMRNNFSIGFNVLEFYDIPLYDDPGFTSFSIMPLQAAFIPVNIRDMFFLSVYGKAGLRLTRFENENRTDREFYGAIGTKFFLFPTLRFNYAPYFSLFLEYNTRNELRIGLGADLSFLFFPLFAIFTSH